MLPSERFNGDRRVCRDGSQAGEDLVLIHDNLVICESASKTSTRYSEFFPGMTNGEHKIGVVQVWLYIPSIYERKTI